ncbi:MAG: subtilisin [Halobacteriales archaeon]|jgi:subtilisin
MADNNSHVSRRDVLRGAAGAVGAAALAGQASAGGSEGDRVIVGLRANASFDVARRNASSVHRELDFDGVGKAVSGRFSDAAIGALENNPNVRYVEENGRMQALAQTLPWGIDRVDADVLHDNAETGNGADVAILDTGIDSDHYDLSENVAGGKCFADECCGQATGGIFGCDDNTNDCNSAWDDDNDHGTHCAGTADAIDDSEGVVGVSTEANLWAGKVLNGCGSGSYDNIAAGIEWAADQGFDVASMSLGGSSSSVVKDACQYAYDNGVLLVAAAGNDGPCTDCVGYPAAYSTVIAVSATSSDDTLASFSSTGPEVELAAPGESVLSTVPPESSSDGLDTFSGTSMACPHVSGAGAQLMANGYSNTEARTRLQDTAEDIGLGDNEQGSGLLDAENAVLGGSTDSAPSVSWANPADGDTVSGTITVQISASDSEDSDDSLDVTYNVDGGSSRSTTYNSTSGYYEDSWDTTTVSDGDHTLEANATDSAGNTSTSSITVTTDNTESAPTVDSLSATEVETSDSDAEFDVSWSVSDDDGDLSSVDLSLTDDTDSESEDSASISVSGSSASGTTRLVAAGDDGSGNSYTVDATVTDSNGNTGSGSTSVSETESTNSAPSASIDTITDNSNPAWDRFTVDWSASDSDGNLDTVVVELLDSSGSVLDSASNNVSGSSASGSDEVRTKASADGVEVTATDTDGASGSDSQSV